MPTLPRPATTHLLFRFLKDPPVIGIRVTRSGKLKVGAVYRFNTPPRPRARAKYKLGKLRVKEKRKLSHLFGHGVY